jgi:hypothetical protein
VRCSPGWCTNITLVLFLPIIFNVCSWDRFFSIFINF